MSNKKINYDSHGCHRGLKNLNQPYHELKLWELWEETVTGVRRGNNLSFIFSCHSCGQIRNDKEVTKNMNGMARIKTGKKLMKEAGKRMLDRMKRKCEANRNVGNLI